MRRFCGFHQIIDHRLRTFFRERLVSRVLAIGIGMSADFDIGGRTAQRGFDQAVEQARRIRIDRGAGGLEADPSPGSVIQL